MKKMEGGKKKMLIFICKMYLREAMNSKWRWKSDVGDWRHSEMNVKMREGIFYSKQMIEWT